MSRALRLVPLLLLLLTARCAGPVDFGARYQASHPGTSPPLPHPGQAPEDALAALYLDPAPEAQVEIPLLLLRRTDLHPWKLVAREALASSPGRMAAIALRECRPSRGWIRPRVTRSAWFLFSEGGLVAWDLPRFGEACSVHHSYRAARGELARDEQAVTRWLAQRHADALPQPDEHLRMGLSLVAAERLDEAQSILREADHSLHALEGEVQQAESAGDDGTLQRLKEREKRLREGRAALARAIDARLDAQQQQQRARWQQGL